MSVAAAGPVGGPRVLIGIAVLIAAYVLSQFYRAFLAVLTPELSAELGATPEILAYASGVWFVCFAAMQVPIGWALDVYGPRRLAAGLLAVGAGGGAVLFGLASAPWHIVLAMALIGVVLVYVLRLGGRTSIAPSHSAV